MEASLPYTLDEYTLIEQIGSGGMSTVYRAITPDGEEVALKLLSPGASNVRHFREVWVLRQLNGHPNMPRYRRHTTRYLVMELLQGVNLATYVDRGGTLTHEEAYDILGQICDALANLHELDTVHRDVKPENIFLTQREGGGWHATLIDFGAVKILGEEEFTNQHLLIDPRARPVAIGSLGYMSPEQAGCEPLAPSSDLYAVGIVLFLCLTGQVLHRHDMDRDAAHIMEEMYAGKKPDDQFAHQVAPSAWDLLLRLLAQDQSQRPSASETAQLLRALARGEESSSQQEVVRTDVPKSSPSSASVRSAVLAMTVLSALVTALCVVFAWRRLPSRGEHVPTSPIPIVAEGRTRTHAQAPPTTEPSHPSPSRSTLAAAPPPASCSATRGLSYSQGLRVGRERLPDRGCWNRIPLGRKQKLCRRFTRFGHGNDQNVRELCQNQS